MLNSIWEIFQNHNEKVVIIDVYCAFMIKRNISHNMSVFNEAQLEQAFVELFKAEGYDYVHGENISRDTRDVILYDDLRAFLRE